MEKPGHNWAPARLSDYGLLRLSKGEKEAKDIEGRRERKGKKDPCCELKPRGSSGPFRAGGRGGLFRQWPKGAWPLTRPSFCSRCGTVLWVQHTCIRGWAHTLRRLTPCNGIRHFSHFYICDHHSFFGSVTETMQDVTGSDHLVILIPHNLKWFLKTSFKFTI